MPFNLVGVTLLIVGGALGGTPQWVLWTLAAALLWVTPYLTTTEGFVVSPSHFVERHGLVIIIALGESIVVIGAGASGLAVDAELLLVSLLSLALSAALWWLYFSDEGAVEAAMVDAPPERRPQLALNAFGYWHYGLLLGIVALAAGLKKAVGDPYHTLDGWIAVELAAGVALFVACDVGFRRTLGITGGRVRLLAAVAALATIPLGLGLAASAQVGALAARRRGRAGRRGQTSPNGLRSPLAHAYILSIVLSMSTRPRAAVSVPHALLALLSEGPKYGLRLQSEFESRTGEVWPLNVGQVYTTLQRLERDGLVETDDGEGERSRKRYRITSAGDRELADWLRTPPDLVPPPRDELVIKVLVALQVPGTDVHEILQVHRRHVIEVMQRYTQVKAAAGEDDVALALVADAELFRLEAIVRWLDAADVRLKQRPPSRRPQWPTCLSNQLTRWRFRNDQRTRTAPGIEGLRLRADRGARAHATSTSRSSAASWWRSWGRAARARARS